MQITNHIDPGQQRIEISVSGPVTQDNACGLIQYAIAELEGNRYREAMLDLRHVSANHPITLFRLHALMQVFKGIIMRKNMHLAILFNEENREQWIFLDRAANCDGINMKYFTNRQEFKQVSYAGCDTQRSSVH